MPFLDFALEKGKSRYDFRAYLDAIKSELDGEGDSIEFKVNDKKIVHSAFVQFPGLLFELGLSHHRSEVLAIKIEVNTDPPLGAGLTTSRSSFSITTAPRCWPANLTLFYSVPMSKATTFMICCGISVAQVGPPRI